MKRIIGKIIRNKIAISMILSKLILDVFLYIFSNFLSVIIRFDFTLTRNFMHIDDWFGILEVLVFIVSSLTFRLPLQSFEFASIPEISEILAAVFVSKAVLYSLLYLSKTKLYFSRGAFAISFLISFLLISGIRIVYRWFYNSRKKVESKNRPKTTVIVGAGDAGEQILREIINHPESSFKVVGFLDDDPFKKRVKIHGISVLGPIDRLPYIIKQYGIDVVIHAIPTASRDLLKKVFDLAAPYNVEIKTLPAIWEIVSGKVTVVDIRNVELEDLLPRTSIKMYDSPVADYIKEKVVLVTGAGGSIGSEISRQIVKYNPSRIILLGRGENRIFDIERELVENRKYTSCVPVICDIKNREKIFKVFEEYHPQVVFHAAANKHVPLMEKNPDEAVLNNVFGTINLLDASVQYKIERFINISTDKAVNPTSVMGASKKIVELLIQLYSMHSENTIFASVRFGNVLGSRGSVAEVFKRQINETGEITITDPNMERYFMLTSEAVQLVLHAGAMSNGGEIFVLKMGEPVNILDFAKQFIRLSGKEFGKDVKIKIIGNRGGEKIKEELWGQNEKVIETGNPYVLKIVDDYERFVAKDFYKKLETLKEVALKFETAKIKSLLKEIVSESNL